VVIRVHSPKFPHEADHAAVVRSVARHRIAHPVLDDPELETWQQYGVRLWRHAANRPSRFPARLRPTVVTGLPMLPVDLELRLDSSGSGVLVVDVIASTCTGDVCTVVRVTREHQFDGRLIDQRLGASDQASGCC
jgi:hypothetical protein